MTVGELKEILSRLDNNLNIEIDNSDEEYGPTDITFIIQKGSSVLLLSTYEEWYKIRHEDIEDKWILYKEK